MNPVFGVDFTCDGNPGVIRDNPFFMDLVSKAILETVGHTGYSVTIERDRLTAVDEQSGERFIVRHGRDDFYDAVVELARQVGIELEDG